MTRLFCSLLILVGLLGFAPAAEAQECITCRATQCSGMFWLESCAAKKKIVPKPVPRVEVTPATGLACTADKPLRLDVDLPSVIYEGDQFGLRVRASCEAHVLVVYVEESGGGAVLWPSELEPDPIARPHAPVQLPGPREASVAKSLEAQLRTPGTIAKERLLVVGVASTRDLKRVTPDKPADLKQWRAGLDEALRALPAGTTHKLERGYEILPMAQRSATQRKPR